MEGVEIKIIKGNKSCGMYMASVEMAYHLVCISRAKGLQQRARGGKG